MNNPDAARPSLYSRLAVALIIASLAAAFYYIHARHWGFRPSDFSIVWFGAQAMLHGANPYVLVGPGNVFEFPWPHLFYPAPAMVVALPFTLLPQLAATMAFVFVSSLLLAFALTADGWHRLPIFLSAPFLVGVGAAQWSTLLTAGFMWAPVAVVFAAKPTIGLAMLLATASKRVLWFAIVGGVVLTATGFLLFPAWPVAWLQTIRGDVQHFVPVMRPGGALILFALIRWRRPEARLLGAIACVPQTPSWYESLPVLLAAQTYRENLILALLSWVGFFLEQLVMVAANELDYNRQVAMLMIALIYLPATWMVLRRPNEGELPAFVRLLQRRDAQPE